MTEASAWVPRAKSASPTPASALPLVVLVVGAGMQGAGSPSAAVPTAAVRTVATVLLMTMLSTPVYASNSTNSTACGASGDCTPLVYLVIGE